MLPSFKLTVHQLTVSIDLGLYVKTQMTRPNFYFRSRNASASDIILK